MDDPLHPPIPPISARDEPRFGSAERKRTLASAFAGQGADYDRLRPGYPDAVLDAMLAPLAGSAPTLRAIDLGAGTGKLSGALAERGLEVTAVDTSEAMLEVARARGGTITAGSLATRLARAEETGLPAASAELVTVAQAWHWFDAEEASAEVARLLAPGGVLALVWNMLDVTIPWVHRLPDHARRRHPPRGSLPHRRPRARAHRPPRDHLGGPDAHPGRHRPARTRKYVITAPEERRQKLANSTGTSTTTRPRAGASRRALSHRPVPVPGRRPLNRPTPAAPPRRPLWPVCP